MLHAWITLNIDHSSNVNCYCQQRQMLLSVTAEGRQTQDTRRSEIGKWHSHEIDTFDSSNIEDAVQSHIHQIYGSQYLAMLPMQWQQISDIRRTDTGRHKDEAHESWFLMIRQSQTETTWNRWYYTAVDVAITTAATEKKLPVWAAAII